MANATLSNANTANLTMYQVDLQHDIPQTILSACSCLHAQSLEDACCAIDLLFVPLVKRGPRVSLPEQCSGTLHAVKGLPWRAE